MPIQAVGFGPHLTLDCYGCAPEKLKDESFITHFLSSLPSILGMHKFNSPMVSAIPAQPKSFDKGGLTGFVILVESHIAIHTFPQDGFATVDIFSCKLFDEKKAVSYVVQAFGAEKWEINRLDRGKEFVKHYPRNRLKAEKVAKRERSTAVLLCE